MKINESNFDIKTDGTSLRGVSYVVRMEEVRVARVFAAV
jgi:hypothetical protein